MALSVDKWNNLLVMSRAINNEVNTTTFFRCTSLIVSKNHRGNPNRTCDRKKGNERIANAGLTCDYCHFDDLTHLKHLKRLYFLTKQ